MLLSNERYSSSKSLFIYIHTLTNPTATNSLLSSVAPNSHCTECTLLSQASVNTQQPFCSLNPKSHPVIHTLDRSLRSVLLAVQVYSRETNELLQPHPHYVYWSILRGYWVARKQDD
jgi:hypothetical protein